MAYTQRSLGFVAVCVGALVAIGGSTAAGADPVTAGTASSFAITADVFGTEVIPPTPVAETTAPADGETDGTLIPIPAGPLVVSGTLIARSAVHTESDLLTTLGQPASAHSVAGPYNARAVGQIESAQVLIDEQVPGGQLINAELVTAEAVAVCKGEAVQYSASSEVVNLQIGGEDPFSGPLNEALAGITDGLAPLADLISVDLNVVTPSATGVSVDAIVVTLLQAAVEGGAPGPLVKVVLGHAEVSGVTCAGPALPSTSDDDETDDDATVLGDSLAKTSAGSLPSTGGAVPTAVAAGLGMGALSLFALRRRLA